MIDARVLLDIARSYVGAPFVRCGRSRDGVDCAGLPIAALIEAGAVATDWCADLGDYEVSPRRPLVLRELQKRCSARLKLPEAGALLAFAERHPYGIGWPTLLAIAADRSGRRVVCALPERGVIETSVPLPLHSIWSLPGIDYPSCPTIPRNGLVVAPC